VWILQSLWSGVLAYHKSWKAFVVRRFDLSQFMESVYASRLPVWISQSLCIFENSPGSGGSQWCLSWVAMAAMVIWMGCGGSVGYGGVWRQWVAMAAMCGAGSASRECFFTMVPSVEVLSLVFLGELPVLFKWFAAWFDRHCLQGRSLGTMPSWCQHHCVQADSNPTMVLLREEGVAGPSIILSFIVSLQPPGWEIR
jgi:hypothetical protein